MALKKKKKKKAIGTTPKLRAKPQSMEVVGWREWIHLPELKSPAIKVKIDSGARTSTLHAEDIVLFIRKGKRMVRFRVYPHQKDRRESFVAEAPLLEQRSVRSSVGHLTHRPVIITDLELGDRRWPIELTLVDRNIMGFRMLLGRQAIRKHFLIDCSRSFLHGQPRRRSKKAKK